MDAQQLADFIKQTQTEIDWHGDKLMAWIHPYDLRDFCNLIGYEYLSDGGYPAHIMFNGTVCLELNDLCEDFEIDPEQILPREKGANANE